MPELLDSKRQRAAHLPSIRQALELLNASEEVKEQVNLSLDKGEKVTVADINKLKQKSKEKYVGFGDDSLDPVRFLLGRLDNERRRKTNELSSKFIGQV